MICPTSSNSGKAIAMTAITPGHLNRKTTQAAWVGHVSAVLVPFPKPELIAKGHPE